MPDEEIKCPICGTRNEGSAEKCKMCKTRLAKKEGGKVSVSSPKPKGKTFTMIDIEDPITRKRLEELTLIPGVTRKKALFLYQSGIHSIEEFLQKAFHGERFSQNYSRTVSNKLLLQSLKGEDHEPDIPCPSCEAPNPAGAVKCKVCNFDIKKEMEAIDMARLSSKLTDSVQAVLGELSQDADFDSLPEDMKAQMATLLESDDVDFDMEKPVELDALGIDLDKLDAVGEEADSKAAETPAGEPVPEEPAPAPEKAPEIEKAPEPKEEKAPEAKEKETLEAKEKKPSKEEKIRRVLTDKIDQWRKAGYDVDGLDGYLEDVEGFKAKAKENLSKGKVVRNKCAKQLEMWKAKGFDVAELEPLLDTDVTEFIEKAKDVLKKQKK